MPSLALKASINYPFIGGSSAPVDPLLNQLLAFYSCAGTIADITGNGNDLGPQDALGNNPSYVSNSRLKIGNITSAFSAQTNILNQTNDYTMICWLSSYDPYSNTIACYNIGDTAGGGIGVSIFDTPTGVKRVCASNDNGDNNQVAGFNRSSPIDPFFATLALSTPTFFVTTYTGSTQLLTFSGQNISGTKSNSVTLSVVNDNTGGWTFALGDLSQNGRFAQSPQVRTVGIWQRVLTGSEITRLYNSGTPLNYPF